MVGHRTIQDSTIDIEPYVSQRILGAAEQAER